MADNTPSANTAAAIARISSLTGVREPSIAAVLEYEILPSQVTLDATSEEAVHAVKHMLAELSPDTTADKFSEELNILSHAVPAIRNDPQQQKQQQAASLEEHLAILNTRCFLAVKVLQEQKKEYLSNMCILNQDLKAKIAAAGGAFDSDWDRLEATDDWPKAEAKRLEEQVGDRPFVEKHEGYLKEIAAYWKEFAGKETALLYQKGWELVAGYKLKWEY